MNVKVIIRNSIIFLLSFHIGIAQTNHIQFNLVEGHAGVPLRKITAITQDPRGYMWFAGQGAQCLYRYDGSNLKSYSMDTSNPNSLGGTSIETVYADDKGYIWIGFSDNGLDQFNPLTGIFKHYRNISGDPGSLSDNLVSCILRDSKGRLWVGSDGLERLDEETGKFIHYKNKPGDPQSLSSNVVNKIYEDRNGTIWVGTGFPWFNRDPEDGGLNRLEPDGSFTRFMHDPKDPQSLINNKVRSIFEDSRGVFWVGTNSDGLHTMDRGTGQFIRHRYNPAKPDQLSRPPITKEDLNDPITFIHEDKTGFIWIATRSGGINRYDTATKKITNYKNSNGFPDATGWCAYTSRDGVLWISTEEENLYRIDPMRKSLKNTTGAIINAFREDDNGFIWAGTDGRGLWQYDRNKNLITKYTSDPNIAGSLFNDEILSLFHQAPDSIWVGTFNGLGIFNIKTKQFSKFLFDTSMESQQFNPFTSIFRDQTGFFWFTRLGGPASKVLIKYDPLNGEIKYHSHDPNDSSSISSNMIHSGIADMSGDIWTAGSSVLDVKGGISRLNRQSGRFESYLTNINFQIIFEDKSGKIWAGSGQGLYRFNRSSNRFLPFFDSESGIGEAGIYGMTEDKEKNLWVSTSYALIKINPARDQITNIGSKFGIAPNSLKGNIFRKSDGEILVGNKTGFFSFYPRDLSFNIEPSELNITGVFINTVPLAVKKNSSSSVEDLSEISLVYNQNNISINFAITDYRAPESNKFFTRLEGYDSVWHETGAEKSAYYYNVAPGDYIFQIKAFDSDGKKLEKTLAIHILPPWWKTWWAYLSYGIILISIFYVLDRAQKQRIIQRERQKAQVIELAQAKEIEKAYHELRSTQTQLIHSEKMASLGELTAGIAHEIQNPLNFVNNFADMNSELIDEMQQEMEKGNLAEAKAISGDIKENEIKISHHGKRADAIVKSMLQHSRTSSGQKELTNINALCDEYLRLAYHGLRGKDKSFNASIETNFDETIGKINIIPQDIGRVLLNLYNNAFYALSTKALVKAHSSYQPTISVSTKKTGNKIEISVKDNGAGIPASIKEKIFQPFFTTKPTGQGTGLGLSLSYDIIKAHNGEIKLESTEGEGSTFVITLAS